MGERVSSFQPTEQGYATDPRVLHPVDGPSRFSIKYAFERWAHNGDPNVLMARSISLQSEQVPSLAMIIIYDFLRHKDQPYLFLTHESMKTVDEKMDMFEKEKDMIASFLRSDEKPICITTVTLKIPVANRYPARVAVTSLNGKIDSHIESYISSDLAISKKAVKKRIINPSDWQPEIALGLEEGIIGPFIPGPTQGGLHAFYYVENAATATTPVEIALSQKDSLIVSKATFEELLEAYEQVAMGGTYFKRIPLPAAA